MFSELLTDRISVVTSDGKRHDDIPAVVNSKEISIMQKTPLIESGNFIFRTMSNGGEEAFKVIDPGFHEEFYDIPAGYNMKVEKQNLVEARSAIKSLQFHVSGNNARINYQSTDNSINIVNENPALVEHLKALREAIDALSLTADEKDDAVAIIDSVEAQFLSGKPNKSVLKALLSGLPALASATQSITAIIEIAKQWPT